MTETGIITPHKEGCKGQWESCEAFQVAAPGIDWRFNCTDPDCDAEAVVSGEDILKMLEGKS